MKDEKILQDEILSEEELEQVAGGTPGETADDSRFLNVLLQGTKYHQCDRYGSFRIFFNQRGEINDVAKSWESLGIKFFHGEGLSNIYSLNGKNLSRDEAWEYAQDKVGKHLTKAQWDW